MEGGLTPSTGMVYSVLDSTPTPMHTVNKNTRMTTVKVSTRLATAIKQVAQQEGRYMGYLFDQAVEEWLLRRGIVAPKDGKPAPAAESPAARMGHR